MTDATGIEGVAEAAAAQENTDAATSGNVDNSSSGTNPAWAPILDKLPGPYQELVKPHFAEWDKNFEKVQSAYAPFKPYAEQGVTPQQMQEAMTLHRMASSEDGLRQIYDNLVTAYGEQWGLTKPQAEQAAAQTIQQQGNPAGQGQNEFDLSEPDPNYVSVEKYNELKQNTEIIANYLASKEQQQSDAKAQQEIDAAIDQEVETLRGKYGEALNDKALNVIYKLAAGSGAESIIPAAEEYFGMVGQSAQTNPGVPRVLSPGGGTPSSAVDVTSLNRQDTLGLARQYLAALKNQGD
jgi:hypothetical protein